MWRKILGVLCGVTFAASVFATPPNTPTLDGRPLEYDAGDPQAAYTGGGGAFGPGNFISNLHVTWDETYLYIALQGAEADNKLVVMLDVDPDAGTGATTTTNWSGVDPAYIQYNDVGWQASDATNAIPFGLDYQFATEGFYNNIVQILYDGVDTPSSNNVAILFDEGNGSVPVGRAVDMAVQADETDCELKGIEAKIAWSILYPQSGTAAERFGTVQPGEVVPRGAKLRLFANIHNDNPGLSYSSNDAIPEQVSPNASWDAGLLITDTYLDVDVDADNDGLPDVEDGDVNAPYIRAAVGAADARSVFVYFSEPVEEASVVDENAWSVAGSAPSSATLVGDALVQLELTNDLPGAGASVMISITGVEDLVGNTRMASFCLNPVEGGLTNSLTVRFVLDTASGMGLSPGATNFFVNGGSFPLEFGYPPSTYNQLLPIGGSLYALDVVFPPGTAPKLNYKYSAQLSNTGTNNYEAVRLQDYANATRKLTLPTDVASIVVTDYLGAAAGPWRDPANEGYNDLYLDPYRGDAGVRERITVLFQLDLSSRDLRSVDRVLIQGTDPLRGFNYSDAGEADWAGDNNVGWDIGGLELFDDGTLGDEVAGDGIYSRMWALTDDGKDQEMELGGDGSLVGGSLSTLPYIGMFWEDARTPRSMIYKFYVVKNDGNYLESPDSDIELYIEDTAGTNVVLSPFVWANDGLPLPPPSNSPTMSVPVPLPNRQVQVSFENMPSELQHGLWISTNLAQGWMDFGTRVTTGSSGNWTAVVKNANAESEMYAAFAGPAKAPIGMYFEPNPLPAEGGTLRVWYRQHGRALAGARDVGLTGDWNGWGTGKPMTFAGDGAWYYDLELTGSTPAFVEFKARSVAGDWEAGDNVRAYKGEGRATWTPARPESGEVLTVTYDAAGGPLETATAVYAHLGFDEGWFGSEDLEMTSEGGTLWSLDVTVDTNAALSVNFVFRNAGGNVWDSEGNHGNGGRQYRVFLDPYPYP